MLPLYKEVVVGMDSYHLTSVVAQLAHSESAARSWHKGKAPVSVMLRGGGVVKSLDQFDKHTECASFMAMLQECQRNGVTRPSSYSDCFHQLFQSPRVPYSVNHYFAEHFAGGWQEARETGKVRGHLFKYDLNSAYLWSGSQGLPDTQSFSYTDVLAHPDALYLVRIVPNPAAPFPFNRLPIVIAQLADIDLYALTVLEVIGGVRWTRQIDGDEILKVVNRFSFYKAIGRSYWGRWGSLAPIRCKTLRADATVNKEWPLRNGLLNFVWAQLIINRVKRRVFETDASPIHIFVDSIITRKRVSTGTGLGDWKLVDDYRRGLEILGPGWYGVPGGPLIKHAGAKVVDENPHKRYTSSATRGRRNRPIF